MCSNFWMFLGEGEKHWTCFHPDDAPLLHPQFDADDQIDRFPPLSGLCGGRAIAPQARRVDFVLGAGELLYIPWGTPHEVINLSRTASVSANYLDQTNIQPCLEQGRAKLQRRTVGSARHANLQFLMRSLDEIDWPAVDEELESAFGVADSGRAIGAPDRAADGGSMVGMFAAHERLMHTKPVTLGKLEPNGGGDQFT